MADGRFQGVLREFAVEHVCECVSYIWLSEAPPPEKASESCHRHDGWLGNVCRSSSIGPPLLISTYWSAFWRRIQGGEAGSRGREEIVGKGDKAQSIHFFHSLPSESIYLQPQRQAWEKNQWDGDLTDEQGSEMLRWWVLETPSSWSGSNWS